MSVTTSTTDTTIVKGPGLARGPAFIIGLVLSAFGLILFFTVAGTPLSTAGFPDAQVQGQRFLGFEANAWTAWLTIVAGVLLLIGAAQHLVAKATSLIVGLALGAAAVIALIDGDDVLGLAAANGLTTLGWGIAAALLLANTLLPRVRRERPVERQDAGPHADHRFDPDRQVAAVKRRDADRDVVTTNDGGAERDHGILTTNDHDRNRDPRSAPAADRQLAGARAPASDLDWRSDRAPLVERVRETNRSPAGSRDDR